MCVWTVVSSVLYLPCAAVRVASTAVLGLTRVCPCCNVTDLGLLLLLVHLARHYEGLALQIYRMHGAGCYATPVLQEGRRH